MTSCIPSVFRKNKHPLPPLGLFAQTDFDLNENAYKLLEKTIRLIEERDPDFTTRGLYRTSGAVIRSKMYLSKANEGNLNDDQTDYSEYHLPDLTSAVKELFSRCHRLVYPLPMEMASKYAILEHEPLDDRIKFLRVYLWEYQTFRMRKFLRLWLLHLKRITEQSHVNLMKAKNLALIVAPRLFDSSEVKATAHSGKISLFKSAVNNQPNQQYIRSEIDDQFNVVELLIEHADEIFDDDFEKPTQNDENTPLVDPKWISAAQERKKLLKHSQFTNIRIKQQLDGLFIQHASSLNFPIDMYTHYLDAKFIRMGFKPRFAEVIEPYKAKNENELTIDKGMLLQYVIPRYHRWYFAATYYEALRGLVPLECIEVFRYF